MREIATHMYFQISHNFSSSLSLFSFIIFDVNVSSRRRKTLTISCWWSCTLQPGDWNEKKVRLLSFSSINLYNPFNFVFTYYQLQRIDIITMHCNVSHVMYSWQSDIHLEGWNVEVLHAKLHMLLSFKRGNCEIKSLEHLGIISLLPSIGILTS